MRIVILVALIVSPLSAIAEIKLEGYSKVSRQGRHVGFSVRREEFDAVRREWIFKTYIFTINRDQNEHQIKIITRHTDRFVPLESSFEETVNGVKSQSHMKFDGFKYLAKFKTQKKRADEKGSLEPNQFLREATYRVLLGNPIAKGKVFRMRFVREDLAKHSVGHLHVRDQKVIDGRKVYQVVNDSELFSEEVWLSETGQILFTRLTNVDAIEEPVASADEAIGSLSVDRSEMVSVFQEIPAGQKNWRTLARSSRETKGFNSKFKTRMQKYPDAIPLRLLGNVSK